jgi:NADPH-dependent 7-cyano-7-deazaguanine reductase QueF-like protein
MSTIERQSVIEQIGIVANQAGYLGVQAWTTDNVPVGQWLEKSGTRLITPSVAESSVP